MSPEEYMVQKNEDSKVLLYVRQIGTKIEFCFKGTDLVYHVEEITSFKALQLAEQLVRMAAFALQHPPG